MFSGRWGPGCRCVSVGRRMGWGREGPSSPCSKSSELVGSRWCLPQWGPLLSRKPGLPLTHLLPILPAEQAGSTAPSVFSRARTALRPCLRSPKLDPPRVSLAEKCMPPHPSPQAPLRHRNFSQEMFFFFSQELFFYARTHLLTCRLGKCHPCPTALAPQPRDSVLTPGKHQ